MGGGAPFALFPLLLLENIRPKSVPIYNVSEIDEIERR